MRWSFSTAGRSGISRSRSKRAHGRRKTSTCRVRRAAVGQLEVTSDPPGARVTIDGAAVGATPLTLRNVNAARQRRRRRTGRHDRRIERSTSRRARARACSFLSPADRGRQGSLKSSRRSSCASWKTASSSGLSTAAPLMLACGRAQIRARQRGAEVHLARSVTVDAGKTARLKRAGAERHAVGERVPVGGSVRRRQAASASRRSAKSRCPWAVAKSCGGIRSLVKNGRQSWSARRRPPG